MDVGMNILNTAQTTFVNAAAKLQNNIDPANVVAMTTSQTQFNAGIKVLKMNDDMTKQLLNILV